MTIDEFSARLTAIRAMLIAKGYDEYSRPVISVDTRSHGVVYEPWLYLRGETIRPQHSARWTADEAMAWLEAEAAALPRRGDPKEYAPWFEGGNSMTTDEMFTVIDQAKSRVASDRARLDQIRAHLGAALVQTIDSDDKIIVEHMRAAYELARAPA